MSFGWHREESGRVGGDVILLEGSYTHGYQRLSEEIKAKARACATSDELVELAKSGGVDLSLEELDAVSGGTMTWCSDKSVDDQCDTYCSMVAM